MWHGDTSIQTHGGEDARDVTLQCMSYPTRMYKCCSIESSCRSPVCQVCKNENVIDLLESMFTMMSGVLRAGDLALDAVWCQRPSRE